MISESDRSIVFNFAKQENFVFDFIFHNSIMLKPRQEDSSMDHFRYLMELIIERPMFINSELIENKLLTDTASIFHINFD